MLDNKYFGKRILSRPSLVTIRAVRVIVRCHPIRVAPERVPSSGQRSSSSDSTVSDISHAVSSDGSSIQSAKNESRPPSTVILYAELVIDAPSFPSVDWQPVTPSSRDARVKYQSIPDDLTDGPVHPRRGVETRRVGEG